MFLSGINGLFIPFFFVNFCRGNVTGFYAHVRHTQCIYSTRLFTLSVVREHIFTAYTSVRQRISQYYHMQSYVSLYVVQSVKGPFDVL